LQPYIISTDVILAMAPLFARIPGLQDLGKPAIVDLYDPFELEKLAQSAAIDPRFHEQIDIESAHELQLASSLGDFFICASERQRDFWLGVLLDGGRLNTLTYNQDPTVRALIDVVPFGIPDIPPQKQQNRLKGIHPGIGPEDKLLLWNGGLWQWFDPLTLIEAMAQVARIRSDVRLYFAAGRHFDLDTVPEMPIYAQVIDRCRDLELLDRHVFFGDWIPYDERGDYLVEADLGVSIHQAGLESRFSSRTRLLDCIWAGLPVIATAGDPLSDIVAEHQLGYVLPPGQPELLAQRILEALADESLRERVSVRVGDLRAKLSWNYCAHPIAAFLERAAFAPDALQAAKRASHARLVSSQLRKRDETIERLEQRIRELDQEKAVAGRQVEELQTHIDAIARGRFMRFSRAVRIALGRE
jgi:glycosyltransferase involved in cell wall biosynthesis